MTHRLLDPEAGTPEGRQRKWDQENSLWREAARRGLTRGSLSVGDKTVHSEKAAQGQTAGDWGTGGRWRLSFCVNWYCLQDTPHLAEEAGRVTKSHTVGREKVPRLL